ncbi:MAG: LCP family protein [Anaerolineae bacterium]|nr:LCP family protein [Anaerolineae bacterium]
MTESISDPLTLHPRRRRSPLMTRLRRLARHLPVPTLGRFTPAFGVIGAIAFTLFSGLLVGLVVRAVMVSDALNPFREEIVLDTDVSLPDLSTPDPASSRVTVLVLGTDTRPSEQGYRTPTDSLILLSIDRETKQATMLSLPRDLYVDVPGRGPDRINTAYVAGGGPVAMQVVEDTLGVPVDHYMVVQFGAFTTLVDQIGGIDIYVPYEINDPEFPAECYSRSDCGFEPLFVPAGLQHMDGYTALRYARTRHGDSDYERARRQQAVIFAIRDRVVSFSMLPTLIQKAPTLAATIGDSLRTDMTLEQMLDLAQLTIDTPDDNIRSAVLDGRYVIPTRTSGGASVLAPDSAKIAPLIDYLFWRTDSEPRP